MDDLTRMFLKVGPGGLKCYCCAPPPGPERTKLVRSARRSARDFAIKEALSEVMSPEELEDYWENQWDLECDKERESVLSYLEAYSVTPRDEDSYTEELRRYVEDNAL